MDAVVRGVYWSEGGTQVAVLSDDSFYLLQYNADVVDAALAGGCMCVCVTARAHACAALNLKQRSADVVDAALPSGCMCARARVRVCQPSDSVAST